MYFRLKIIGLDLLYVITLGKQTITKFPYLKFSTKMFQFNNLQATQIDDLENALLPHLDGDGDKDLGKPFLDNQYF
jgi:hypothetical protein